MDNVCCNCFDYRFAYSMREYEFKDDGSGKDDGNEEASADESNVNKTGMPIVDDTIEMEIFTPKPPQHKNNDWNDILIWNTYKDMTNVDVTWDLVDWDAREEKRNLALGTGDLPDAFFGAELPMADVKKYGDQGTFIELNDLIDEYAPNLKKILEENPDIASAITFPDGKIYSMPSIIAPGSLSINLGARPWINQDWLDELGMDMPETTDEFYEYLKAVKELDPAGDGKTIPYGGTQIAEMVEWLAGSFGVMNAGAVNDNIDADPEDPTKVRFYAVDDGYKEMLEYLNKLYEEGLIQENIFDIEWGQFMTNGEENKYASMVFYDPITLFGNDIGGQYNSLAALEGPNGDQSYTKVASSIFQATHFVITDQNENPEAAVRWMDHFYSDEGTKLYYMGVEGETYEEVDGVAEYTDDLLDEEGNPVEDAILEKLTWLVSSMVRLMLNSLLEVKRNRNPWKQRKKLNHMCLMLSGDRSHIVKRKTRFLKQQVRM